MPSGYPAAYPQPSTGSRQVPSPAIRWVAPAIEKSGAASATQYSKRNTQGKVQSQPFVTLTIGKVNKERACRRPKRQAHAITERQFHIDDGLGCVASIHEKIHAHLFGEIVRVFNTAHGQRGSNNDRNAELQDRSAGRRVGKESVRRGRP